MLKIGNIYETDSGKNVLSSTKKVSFHLKRCRELKYCTGI